MTTDPAQYADQAAEAIRALNHTTLSPGRDGWTYPSDAYGTIGGLDRMAGGLDQALDQVWSLLSGLAADGHVRSDRGTTGRDLKAARDALEAARTAAEQLVIALSAAHSATSPLAYQD